MCLENPEKSLFQRVSKGKVISMQNMKACKEMEVQLHSFFGNLCFWFCELFLRKVWGFEREGERGVVNDNGENY